MIFVEVVVVGAVGSSQWSVVAAAWAWWVVGTSWVVSSRPHQVVMTILEANYFWVR